MDKTLVEFWGTLAPSFASFTAELRATRDRHRGTTLGYDATPEPPAPAVHRDAARLAHLSEIREAGKVREATGQTSKRRVAAARPLTLSLSDAALRRYKGVLFVPENVSDSDDDDSREAVKRERVRRGERDARLERRWEQRKERNAETARARDAERRATEDRDADRANAVATLRVLVEAATLPPPPPPPPPITTTAPPAPPPPQPAQRPPAPPPSLAELARRAECSAQEARKTAEAHKAEYRMKEEAAAAAAGCYLEEYDDFHMQWARATLSAARLKRAQLLAALKARAASVGLTPDEQREQETLARNQTIAEALEHFHSNTLPVDAMRRRAQYIKYANGGRAAFEKGRRYPVDAFGYVDIAGKRRSCSLQTCPREVRLLLAAAFYHDLDFVNSLPVVASQLDVLGYCSSAVVSKLKDYCTNRKDWLTAIIDQHSIPDDLGLGVTARDAAKALPIRLLHGGTYAAWVKEYGVADGGVGGDGGLPSIRALESQLGRLRAAVVAKHREQHSQWHEHAWAAAWQKHIRKDGAPRTPTASNKLVAKTTTTLFTYIIQALEDRCLEAARAELEACGWPTHSLQQDGLLVEEAPRAVPLEGDAGALARAQHAITTAVGIRVAMIEKPFYQTPMLPLFHRLALPLPSPPTAPKPKNVSGMKFPHVSAAEHAAKAERRASDAYDKARASVQRAGEKAAAATAAAATLAEADGPAAAPLPPAALRGGDATPAPRARRRGRSEFSPGGGGEGQGSAAGDDGDGPPDAGDGDEGDAESGLSAPVAAMAIDADSGISDTGTGSEVAVEGPVGHGEAGPSSAPGDGGIGASGEEGAMDVEASGAETDPLSAAGSSGVNPSGEPGEDNENAAGGGGGRRRKKKRSKSGGKSHDARKSGGSGQAEQKKASSSAAAKEKTDHRPY